MYYSNKIHTLAITVLLILVLNMMLPGASAKEPVSTPVPLALPDEEVTNKILEQQPTYFEGRLWNNYSPAGCYIWAFPGETHAWSGCAALTALLSDAVYGSVKECPVYSVKVNADCWYKGAKKDVRPYTWDAAIRPGTIIAFQGHFVMVVRVEGDAVSVVEGNYGGTIHWGRRITREAIESKALYLLRRTPIGFDDVGKDTPYYQPVSWACFHDPQITKGTSKSKFSPNKTVTRAQAATFLWRAAGCPTPKTTVNPFTDVVEGEYYYEAVLWAVEEGITTGTSKTKFSPAKTCSIEQIITFLYRFEHEPDVTGLENPYTDAADGFYSTNPLIWAYHNGIYTGKTETESGRTDGCTRAQIVTFLWRDIAPKEAGE